MISWKWNQIKFASFDVREFVNLVLAVVNFLKLLRMLQRFFSLSNVYQYGDI